MRYTKRDIEEKMREENIAEEIVIAQHDLDILLEAVVLKEVDMFLGSILDNIIMLLEGKEEYIKISLKTGTIEIEVGEDLGEIRIPKTYK